LLAPLYACGTGERMHNKHALTEAEYNVVRPVRISSYVCVTKPLF
jgi:hypothetical protein